MTGDCEFLVRIRQKPELNLKIECSLTGTLCFCEGLPLMCTRRTWALEYEKRHGKKIKVNGA